MKSKLEENLIYQLTGRRKAIRDQITPMNFVESEYSLIGNPVPYVLYEVNLHTIGIIDFLKDNFPEKKIYKVTGPNIIYNYKAYEMKTIKLVTENKFKEFTDYIINYPIVFIYCYMIKFIPKEEHKIRFGYVTKEDNNETQELS